MSLSVNASLTNPALTLFIVHCSLFIVNCSPFIAHSLHAVTPCCRLWLRIDRSDDKAVFVGLIKNTEVADIADAKNDLPAL